MCFRRLSYFFLAPLFLLLPVAVGSAVWLLASENGLRAAGSLLVLASRDRLALDGLRGRLLGPLSVGELRWQSRELSVSARGIELDWTPASLVLRRLEIGELSVDELRVDTPPEKTSAPARPSALPDDLTLPLAVSARRVAVSSLRWNGEALASGISAHLKSDGRRHAVEDLAARSGDVSAAGEASLDGRTPFALKASGQMSGRVSGHTATLSFSANGALARFDLSARVRDVDGKAKARATLTPFAARPLHEARADLHGIDPSAWFPGAPRAKLDIAARIDAAEKDGQRPELLLRIVNRLPGPLDEQRMPLASASVRVVPGGDATHLEDLVLAFPGDGVLNGGGRWSNSALALDLDARRLDVSRLAARLLPTRLAGPLALSLGAKSQSARLAWRGEGFRLTVDAEHADGTLNVKALEIGAQDARLSASGRIDTGGEQVFAVKGTLRRFDPSRFISAHAARIDADVEARGHLAPRPVVEARFTLGESRYAGMPLSGRGRLSLAWPNLRDVDIALAAGPNRLAATGGFGRPEDRLNVRLRAPRLSLLGIDGALRGRLDLTGTPEHPAARFDLAASRLGVAGIGHFSELTLRGGLGSEAGAPLDVELALARFSRDGETESARAVKLVLSGKRQNHRIEGGGEIPASGRWQRLHLAAEGGWHDGGRWRGHLRELWLTEDSGRPRLTLQKPAALEITADGWSAGPLALAGTRPEWAGELSARADTGRLLADAVFHGARLGRIEGHLESRMLGPWRIAADAPWQGRLSLDIADLAWLGGFLGGGWRTGGKLAGALDIAGTPVQPRPRGRLDGSALALSLPEQGLQLAAGELAAEFDGSLLRIARLGFSSVLDEPPRALRQALGDAVERFAKPGRIDVSGELRIGETAAENAFLDVRLDRFGAWQLPDRWIAVSGGGRIAWRAGALGVTGALGVDAGYWQLAPPGMPRLSDDVRVKRLEAPADGGPRPGLDLDLQTDLGRNFLFRGAGLQTRLSGNIRLSAQGHDLPRASGSIRLRDGRFDAYGQHLDIERGILTFHGLLDDPALDVRALRKGLAVEAGVQVTGSAQRPLVRLISDPELPDADKLAWLLLGHGQESMGAGDAALLVSAAGDILGDDSGGVVRQLKDVFGIDEFGIRQGEVGSQGTRGPTSRIAGSSVDAAASSDQILSVGKRLSANIVLAYEQSLTQAESVLKLTYNLTRNVAVVGRAGSDNALDVFYTLSFGQPPRDSGRNRGNRGLSGAEAEGGGRKTGDSR